MNVALINPTTAGERDTSKPVVSAVEPDRHGGEVASRTDRFMARVEGELAILPQCAHRNYLNRVIDSWDGRFRNFLRTDGKSEYCADPSNPVTATDFVMTLAALAARMKRCAS